MRDRGPTLETPITEIGRGSFGHLELLVYTLGGRENQIGDLSLLNLQIDDLSRYLLNAASASAEMREFHS